MCPVTGLYYYIIIILRRSRVALPRRLSYLWERGWWWHTCARPRAVFRSNRLPPLSTLIFRRPRIFINEYCVGIVQKGFQKHFFSSKFTFLHIIRPRHRKASMLQSFPKAKSLYTLLYKYINYRISYAEVKYPFNILRKFSIWLILSALYWTKLL